jgi:VIT1/CCC1 family predicted Fe2+/Mn2+ transporter
MSSHDEKHFTATEAVRDIVIGMSDGLTVPFALAAGLTGAVSSSGIIVTAGLAEIAAGSIAMGLGGYLAARSEAEHYTSEEERERREVVEKHAMEVQETVEIFEQYGLSKQDLAPVLEHFDKHPAKWVDFMMRYELGLEKPDPNRALISAITIAAAYVVGGLLPMSSYFFIRDAREALSISVTVTLVALIVFGYVKGRYTGTTPWRSSLQTTLIGGLAAATAFAIARLIA